ncbi:hypothetical protein Tco_0809829 [Tanacetum coccineum]
MTDENTIKHCIRFANNNDIGRVEDLKATQLASSLFLYNRPFASFSSAEQHRHNPKNKDRESEHNDVALKLYLLSIPSDLQRSYEIPLQLVN